MGPRERAPHFAGLKIQHAQVSARIVLIHRKANAIHIEFKVRHIRQVWQLGDFIFCKPVERAGHQQVTRLADIAFLQRSALTEVSVSGAEDRLALALIFRHEFSFCDQPVLFFSFCPRSYFMVMAYISLVHQLLSSMHTSSPYQTFSLFDALFSLQLSRLRRRLAFTSIICSSERS